MSSGHHREYHTNTDQTGVSLASVRLSFDLCVDVEGRGPIITLSFFFSTVKMQISSTVMLHHMFVGSAE